MQRQVQQSWLDENHNDHMTSPENYTYYQQEFLGNEVPAVKLNKIWRKYHERKLQEALEQACKATGCVAIRSTILTKREKTKHAIKQYIVNKQSYYLFPADEVPLNIYVRLRAREGQLIYEKSDTSL